MSFLDFLHPLWKKSLSEEDLRSRKRKLNTLVLSSIDKELDDVQQDTIAAKAQSFLSAATDEWLDYWGSWFGLARSSGQSDDDYREALINHVQHPRDTVPALRTSISNFLNTSIDNVTIYEPWNDVFILNDSYSTLNSNSKLYGDSIREAIVDIYIAVPFPPEVIDIINWFRPAGVIYDVIYSPGSSSEALIWEAPSVFMQLYARTTLLSQFIGLSNHISGTISPATRTPLWKDNNAFFTNDSLLNSNSLLVDFFSDSRSSSYYAYSGYLYGLMTPYTTDGLGDLNSQVEPILESEKYLLDKKDNEYFNFVVGDNTVSDNLLPYTYQWEGWQFNDAVIKPDISQDDGSYPCSLAGSDAYAILNNRVPNLVSGSTYTVSIVAWTKNKNTDASLSLLAYADSKNSALPLTATLTTEPTRYYCTFTYNNYAQPYFEFYLSGSLDENNSVYLSQAKLEEGSSTDSVYCKGSTYYPKVVADGHKYLYSFFNIDDYFYSHIGSYGDMINSISGDYTREKEVDYILKYMDVFNFVTDLKSSVSQYNPSLSILIYNFHLGIWVVLDTDSLFNTEIDKSFSLLKFNNFISATGIMAISFKFDIVNSPYVVDIDYLCLSLDHLAEDSYGFNFYDTDNQSTTAALLTSQNTVDLSTDTDKDRLRGNFISGYPIRYIKDTVRDVKFADSEDSINPFTLNRSELNGKDELSDYSNYYPVYLSNNKYTSYPVDKSVNSNDATLPIESISVMGATTKDKTHKNFLGNLLPDGIFYNRLYNRWVDKDTSELLTNPSTSDTIFGFSIDDKVKSWSITSDSLLKESNYRFYFSASANQENTELSANVVLNADGYSESVFTSKYIIGSKDGSFNLTFDTNKLFANSVTITFSVVSPTSGYAINFGNTDLRLDTVVTLDGSVISQKTPDMIPSSSNFGHLLYDEVYFNNDIKPMYYDDGLRQDLYYRNTSDKDNSFVGISGAFLTQFISYLNKVYSTLDTSDKTEAFSDNYDKFSEFLATLSDGEKDITYQEAAKLDDYMSTLRYILTTLGPNDLAARDFASLDDDFVSYLNAKGFYRDRQEHSLTLDLGRVYDNIDSLLIHHGSNSAEGAQYEHYLQTSVDGINWKTWYNNYNSSLGDLDYPYIELDSIPEVIELPKYNLIDSCLVGTEEDSPNYYSSIGTRYPVYNPNNSYPHSNIVDNVPSNLLTYGTGESVINVSIGELNSKYAGRKVSVSFSLYSTSTGGTINLEIPDIDFVYGEPRDIHRNYEYFTFSVDIPTTVVNDMNILLSLDKSYGYSYIFGVKLEVGIDDSPLS